MAFLCIKTNNCGDNYYYFLPDKKNLSRLGFHKRISSIFYIIINSKFNKHYKYNITKWIKLSVCISELWIDHGSSL